MDKSKIEKAVRLMLEGIGEDPSREGLKDTPKRVAKAYDFIVQGYKKDPLEVLGTSFTERYNEMVLVKDIEFYSLCEHHMLPFFGKAHIAYIPNGRVLGLSKMARVTDVFARRLQVQERMTEQIADAINKCMEPKGVAVIIEATHLCMQMRGVEKQHSKATTSAMRGVFLTEEKTRGELLNLINRN